MRSRMSHPSAPPARVGLLSAKRKTMAPNSLWRSPGPRVNREVRAPRLLYLRLGEPRRSRVVRPTAPRKPWSLIVEGRRGVLIAVPVGRGPVPILIIAWGVRGRRLLRGSRILATQAGPGRSPLVEVLRAGDGRAGDNPRRRRVPRVPPRHTRGEWGESRHHAAMLMAGHVPALHDVIRSLHEMRYVARRRGWRSLVRAIIVASAAEGASKALCAPLKELPWNV